MKITKLLVIALVGLGMLTGAVTVAYAKDCKNETLTGGKYGEIYVPEGKACWIYNSIIKKGVKADKARLLRIHDSHIMNGNLQVVETGTVVIRDTTLYNGDAQFEKSGYVAVYDSKVKNGGMQVKENTVVKLWRNTVDFGDLQVEKNVEATVMRNHAGGNIQCYENGVLNADYNTADGNLECFD